MKKRIIIQENEDNRYLCRYQEKPFSASFSTEKRDALVFPKKEAKKIAALHNWLTEKRQKRERKRSSMDNITLNLWDDYFDDSTGKPQNTHLYVEESSLSSAV